MKSKIFVNHIDKSIKNNKEFYHFTGNNELEFIDVSRVDIKSKLNDIFLSYNFVYKRNIEVILKNGSKTYEDVIAVKDDNLITLDNKKIPINDILDIKL